MSMKREPQFDLIVSWVLRIGAYAAFALMVAGMAASLFLPEPQALTILKIGVLVMLATPVVRILVAGILFALEKDWRYVAVSAGVLAIVLLGAVFQIA